MVEADIDIDNREPRNRSKKSKQNLEGGSKREKRLMFPISNTTSIASFDLLHKDVWSSFFVATSEGFRYFVNYR